MTRVHVVSRRDRRRALAWDWGRFTLGLGVSATGTVLTIRAGLGLSPWDVLHDGLAQHAPLPFGQAAIAVSLILVVASWAIGIRPGAGTVVNLLLYGIFVDVLLASGMAAHKWPPQDSRCKRSCSASGSRWSDLAPLHPDIGAQKGAGPRDSLQLAVSLRTGMHPGLARSIAEGAAFACGVILEGGTGSALSPLWC